MINFHDVQFPARLAFGASGGPQRRTEIVRLANGHEVRNTAQYHSRRQYNASTAIKTREYAIEINKFFELRRGQLYAFRFRDLLEYSSSDNEAPVQATDQIIGRGDNERTQFQLIKPYNDDVHSYERRITKPVKDTVIIAVSGQALQPQDYSVNALTGLVTLLVPPTQNALVTAGFELDVPVRFDTDAIDIAYEDFGGLQISDIPLVEVLDYANN